MTPSPLQSGQAPLELAENSAASTPFALAKALRTAVEDAGIGRRVASGASRGPRFWSMMTVSG